MLELKNEDFVKLYKFIHANYGIDLSKKKPLVYGRLSSTIASSGYNNFTDYIDHIINDKDKKDIEVVINKLTTNYTYFMRETAHFDFMKQTILPYLDSLNKNSYGIWSAGCSTGEEPYTLSMILLDYFGNKPGKDVRVLATDISQRALSQAVNPVYHKEALKNVPSEWMRKYFRPLGDDTYTVSPVVRKNVIFKTFNLMDPINFKTKFDVIFCRNVMIYFDHETKNELVNRFYNASNAGAYLCIGHSENLSNLDTGYEYVMPSTFRKPIN